MSTTSLLYLFSWGSGNSEEWQRARKTLKDPRDFQEIYLIGICERFEAEDREEWKNDKSRIVTNDIQVSAFKQLDSY